MVSLYEYQQSPDHVSDLLPYAAQVAIDPCVLRHKDGTLQYTLAYRGHDLDAATLHELRANAARLNNVFTRFGTGWGLFLGMRRERIHTYPATVSQHPVIQAVDAERRQYFLEQPHYQSRYTCTLVWKPPTVAQQVMERLLWEVDDPQERDHTADIATFQDQCLRFTGMLADCVAWVEPLDGNALLTELHSYLSDSAHPVLLPEIPMYLDCVITDRDLVPGVQPYLGDEVQKLHLRVLTLRGFPNESYPGMLQALDELPLEFHYMTRWLPLDKLEAYNLIKTRAGLWWQAKDAIRTAVMKNAMGGDVQAREDREALNKTEQLEEAMDNTASGAVTYGYFTGTMVVRDHDAAQADEKLRQVERVITGQGFTVHRETLNAVEAWLGSLPGHCQANVRRPMLHTLNLAHLAPLTAVWPGPTDETPLLLAETRGKTPLHVVLSEHGVGHCLMIGPTGSGKTIAVGLFGLQWAARWPDARIRMFDKKHGLKPVTTSVGGDHYQLSGDTHTGVALQPLRDCDQLGERQWCAAWLEGLIEAQHVVLTPDLRSELWLALQSLASFPNQHRTMTGYKSLLQHEILRQALEPYTLSGAYGQCLDQVAEPLSLSSWSTFETDELFQIPPLVAPTLAVIFRELAKSFQGQPTLLVLDESHRYLSHDVFRPKIEEWLRELRKQNVSIVFSTQDLLELVESPIASVILNNAPTRIFLPNAHAQEDRTAKAYREVGLNERQLELLAYAQPHRDYLFMSRSGIRMAELAIGEYGLKVLTGK
jgi:type IV secretion system protein VirB4